MKQLYKLIFEYSTINNGILFDIESDIYQLIGYPNFSGAGLGVREIGYGDLELEIAREKENQIKIEFPEFYNKCKVIIEPEKDYAN